MAAAAAKAAALRVLWLLFFLLTAAGSRAAGSWCVARSDANDSALQTALDYACGAGADCAPLQSTGLCYLPNTVQAHASYAFNSYYQRRGNAPDSCSFAGTSTIARTDPSYGSCVYPSSARNAGGAGSAGGTPSGTLPGTMEPPPPGTSTTPLYGSGGGSTPDIGSGFPDSSTPNSSPSSLLKTALSPMTTLVLVLWFMFKPSWFVRI